MTSTNALTSSSRRFYNHVSSVYQIHSVISFWRPTAVVRLSARFSSRNLMTPASSTPLDSLTEPSQDLSGITRRTSWNCMQWCALWSTSECSCLAGSFCFEQTIRLCAPCCDVTCHLRPGWSVGFCDCPNTTSKSSTKRARTTLLPTCSHDFHSPERRRPHEKRDLHRTTVWHLASLAPRSRFRPRDLTLTRPSCYRISRVKLTTRSSNWTI